MHRTMIGLCAKFQDLLKLEAGQDLVEYALLIALVSLGAIAGISQVSTALGTAFANISTSVS